MTFLPIIKRELRSASRNRGMLRVRWWATVLAMTVGILALIVLGAARGARLGNPFFNILTGYAFGLSLLAGIGLTADAMSSEKREGTLGLLFMTDMKGYDIVLGKFIPSWLSTFYILLALLPILALPLLVGGVTGGEFWRRALALVGGMSVSLGLGIFVSTFHRQSQRAMVSTLGLVLLLVAGVPGILYLGSKVRLPTGFELLYWLSPFYAYSYSADSLYARHSELYWGPLLGSFLLTVLFLWMASSMLPLLWREGSPGRLWRAAARAFAVNDHTAHRFRARGELLLKNPVSWLTQAELGVPWAAWAVVVACGGTVLALLLINPGSATSIVFSHYGVAPFGFVLKVLFAFQTCKFFSEGRRDGSLELLLCTPLTNREIVRGHALGLWRSFCWPLAAFLACLFAPLGVRLASGILSFRMEPALGALGGSILGGIYTVRMLMDLLAVCWLGMGLAISIKKPQLATGLTILYVLILPAVLSFCFFDIIPDIFFIAWGMAKTKTDLRRRVVQQYAGVGPRL